MPIKALLFDLDGTLVDSAEDLRNALNAVLAEEGLGPLALDEVKEMIGDGVGKLVERGFAARRRTTGDLSPLVARFMALYEPNAARLTRPYPGVAETLDRLKAMKHRLAVVTNKPRAATMRILDALAMSAFFDVVIGGDSLPERKPNPAPLLHAMRELSVSPSETLMVGDNHHDVTAARASGCRVIIVTYGYSHKLHAELGADRLIDNFAAIPDFIRGSAFVRATT